MGFLIGCVVYAAIAFTVTYLLELYNFQEDPVYTFICGVMWPVSWIFIIPAMAIMAARKKKGGE